ncbi:MAG: response regulator transcription factor [Leptospiraceae bacterium]|nr:response regulator transcription factor [Leptospiraceae bacterium]
MSSKSDILLIEDDPDIIGLVKRTLEKDGFIFRAFSSGEDALPVIRENPPDLILLDLILPGKDGLDICKALKKDEQTAHLPILMISSRQEEADIVSGLELGADDYVTKPFSPRVLLARVRAVLRRSQQTEPAEDALIRYRDFTIDSRRFEVKKGDELIPLTKSEFRIFSTFCRRPGWVFTRNQIVEVVHGEMTPVTARSVDVLIVGLRQKLGDEGRLIETVRGIGYRIADESEEED